MVVQSDVRRSPRLDEDEKRQAERKKITHELPPMPLIESFPSADEVKKRAILDLLNDSNMYELRKQRKEKLQEVLGRIASDIQGTMEVAGVQGALENIKYPALHDRSKFADLQALANRDFNIDLRKDEADVILEEYESGLTQRIFEKVTPENWERITALENHNEAVVDRMETMENHLLDRSKQLSQCRYSYFLEITHLRNQVYLQGLNPEEFDPHECYYFDPCDSLEEELREMLNQKIKDSVRVYYGKWRKAEDKLQELQDRLDGLLSTISPDQLTRKPRGMEEELTWLADFYGKNGLVKGMADIFNPEMMQWAKKALGLEGGQDGKMAELERLLREAQEALEAEKRTSADLRSELAGAKGELDAANAKIQDMEGQMMEMQTKIAELESFVEESSASLEEMRQKSLRMGGSMDEASLREQFSGEMQVELGKLRDRISALEIELANANAEADKQRARAEELQGKLDSVEGITPEMLERLKELEKAEQMLAKTRAELANESEKRNAERAAAAQRELEMKRKATEQKVAHAATLMKKNAMKLALDAKKKQEQAEQAGEQQAASEPHSSAESDQSRDPPLDMSMLVKPSQRIVFQDVDTNEEFALYQNEWYHDGKKFGKLKADGRSVTMEFEPKKLPGALKTGLLSREPTSANLEIQSTNLILPENTRLKKVRVESTADEELEKARAELERINKELEEAKNAPPPEPSKPKEEVKQMSAVEGVTVVKSAFKLLLDGERRKVKRLTNEKMELSETEIRLRGELAAALEELEELQDRLKGDSKKKKGGNGTTLATQTTITGSGSQKGSAFYLLEYPALMTELAMEQEFEDLNGCALASWEGILERLKQSRRPPSGVGSGFVSTRLFRRLFLGCIHRIRRQDDLRKMAESLMLAELEKACEAVHLLQESTFPEQCAPIREHIFGRGMNKPNLFENFAASVTAEWLVKLQRCEEVIADYGSDQQIELGVYEPSRRCFVSGGAKSMQRTVLSMHVHRMDGENVNDLAPEGFFEQQLRSPSRSPSAGARLRGSSGGRGPGTTTGSRPPSRSPEKYSGVSGVGLANFVHHAPGQEQLEGLRKAQEMGFNVRTMPMSPRLHATPSPRSRDKWLNLPQHTNDPHGRRNIEEDMRPPAQAPEAGLPGTEKRLNLQNFEFPRGPAEDQRAFHEKQRLQQMQQRQPAPAAISGNGIRGASNNFLHALSVQQQGDRDNYNVMRPPPQVRQGRSADPIRGGGSLLSLTAEQGSVLDEQGVALGGAAAGIMPPPGGSRGGAQSLRIEGHSSNPSSRPGTRSQLRSAPSGSMFDLQGMSGSMHPRAAAHEFLQTATKGLDNVHVGAHHNMMVGAGHTGAGRGGAAASTGQQQGGLHAIRITSSVPPGHAGAGVFAGDAGAMRPGTSPGKARAASSSSYSSAAAPPPAPGRMRNNLTIEAPPLDPNPSSLGAASGGLVDHFPRSPSAGFNANFDGYMHNGLVGANSVGPLHAGRPLSPVHGHRVVTQHTASPKGSPGHSPAASARAHREKLAEDQRHMLETGLLDPVNILPGGGGPGPAQAAPGGGPAPGVGEGSMKQPPFYVGKASPREASVSSANANSPSKAVTNSEVQSLRIQGEKKEKSRPRGLEIRAKSGEEKPQINLFYSDHSGTGGGAAEVSCSEAEAAIREGNAPIGGGSSSSTHHQHAANIVEVRLPPLSLAGGPHVVLGSAREDVGEPFIDALHTHTQHNSRGNSRVTSRTAAAAPGAQPHSRGAGSKPAAHQAAAGAGGSSSSSGGVRPGGGSSNSRGPPVERGARGRAGTDGGGDAAAGAGSVESLQEHPHSSSQEPSLYDEESSLRVQFQSGKQRQVVDVALDMNRGGQFLAQQRGRSDPNQPYGVNYQLERARQITATMPSVSAAADGGAGAAAHQMNRGRAAGGRKATENLNYGRRLPPAPLGKIGYVRSNVVNIGGHGGAGGSSSSSSAANIGGISGSGSRPQTRAGFPGENSISVGEHDQRKRTSGAGTGTDKDNSVSHDSTGGAGEAYGKLNRPHTRG